MNHRAARPGVRVRVVEGAGLSSRATGTIVEHSAIRTNGHRIPIDIEGAYCPVDWRREAAVRLDDGRLITMFTNYLEALPLRYSIAHIRRVATEPHGRCDECGCIEPVPDEEKCR